jgi:uncharacterized protein (DUF885 family)
MLKRLLFVLLLVGLGSSVRATEANAFGLMLERYYEEYLALFPIDAATYGDSDPRHEAVWPDDISAEHRAKVGGMCTKYLAELAGYDRASLTPTEQLSYDTLKWTLTARRELGTHFFHLLPVNQFSAPQLLFAQLASGQNVHPFKTAKDYRNFIRRAQGFSRWVDLSIANMKVGVDQGIVQTRILMERVLPQLEPLMADDPAKNILFGPLAMLPAGLAPAERDGLKADYLAAIRGLMIPAYARLHAYIRAEYLPRCRETAGIGALPGGPAAYASAVRWQTTTDLSPDQIHEIGLREVARIRGEMDKLRLQVGFKGTLPEFITFVATHPQFTPFRTDEEILEAFRAIEGRIMAQVPRFFAHLPRMKFEVRATEKFRVATASHSYSPGTPDGARPGVFEVPIVSPQTYHSPRMENLFLHEAIPGHHFQIALTLENTALPKFRRYDANNAYVEGWALYTERLGQELGLYTDPYQHYGMLLGDMQRAVRLVVDTGLHAKGWSREQALAFAAENEGGLPTAPTHVAKIERYMAAPGQALGYKIGQLKILALRAAAEKQLGEKFDIRAFHDAVLREGALPLAVLEARIQQWSGLRPQP